SGIRPTQGASKTVLLPPGRTQRCCPRSQLVFMVPSELVSSEQSAFPEQVTESRDTKDMEARGGWRSGWLQSIPLSTIATVTGFPVVTSFPVNPLSRED